MASLRDRLVANREFLSEAKWPQIFTPSLGFVDPRRIREYAGKEKFDPHLGQPTKQKLHPKDEPEESRLDFKVNHINYVIPDYLSPGKVARSPVWMSGDSRLGYKMGPPKGAAPIGSWP